jgi:hypothetical protein
MEEIKYLNINTTINELLGNKNKYIFKDEGAKTTKSFDYHVKILKEEELMIIIEKMIENIKSKRSKKQSMQIMERLYHQRQNYITNILIFKDSSERTYDLLKILKKIYEKEKDKTIFSQKEVRIKLIEIMKNVEENKATKISIIAFKTLIILIQNHLNNDKIDLGLIKILKEILEMYKNWFKNIKL